VGADVFGVGKHLMNSGPCPRCSSSPKIPAPFSCSAISRSGLLGRDKPCVDLLDNLDLLLRAGIQNDAIRLQALALSSPEQTLASEEATTHPELAVVVGSQAIITP